MTRQKLFFKRSTVENRKYRSIIFLFSYSPVIPLPKRPGFGRQGRKIQLHGNFFELKIPHDVIIHHYDVTISDGKQEDKIPKGMARQLFEDLVNNNSKVFKTRPVFDGRKNMYSKEPLSFQGVVSFIVIVFLTQNLVQDFVYFYN